MRIKRFAFFRKTRVAALKRKISDLEGLIDSNGDDEVISGDEFNVIVIISTLKKRLIELEGAPP